jgi:hypothetical protein
MPSAPIVGAGPSSRDRARLHQLAHQRGPGQAEGRRHEAGPPGGGAKNLKLDKHADKIDGYLAKGINKVAIAKLLDVSPNTLYEWLKVRRPSSPPAV